MYYIGTIACLILCTANLKPLLLCSNTKHYRKCLRSLICAIKSSQVHDWQVLYCKHITFGVTSTIFWSPQLHACCVRDVIIFNLNQSSIVNYYASAPGGVPCVHRNASQTSSLLKDTDLTKAAPQWTLKLFGSIPWISVTQTCWSEAKLIMYL